MATLSRSLQHVKQHLNQLVTQDPIFEICRQLGHKWRDCVLNPAKTVELFLLQLLAHVALQGLRHVATLQVTAQAICKAKMRLPLKLLMRLVELSVPEGEPQSTWRGLELYMVDGTSFLTPDTPKLARKFGKAKNQRGQSNSYPVPKLLALVDFAGGVIRRVITLPAHRQEFTCLSRLFGSVGKDALLLGDRGLVSFAHLAMLIKAGIHGCFRLPRWQVTYGRGRGSRRLIDRLGKQDLLVGWSASRRPKWMSRKRWDGLAKRELILRQIAYRVHRKGYRVQWAWIVTTLLDPQKYPAKELIALYGKRWQIEVYFRDMKRSLGLQIVSAQTVAGVQKEVLCFVLLYNLVRRVMQRAAQQQQTTSDRISFVDALRWLLYSGPDEAIPRLVVNAVRQRRSPARCIKRGRHRFPQLNGTREETSKPCCETKL